MVKLQGPIASLSASGGLGKTLIFSSNRGRSYMKRWAAPANPQTNPQTSVRAIVAFISERWTKVNQTYRDTWNPRALQNKTSPFNACLTYNLERWTRFAYPTTTLEPTLPQAFLSWAGFHVVQHVRTITFEQQVGAIRDGTGWPMHRGTSAGFSPSNQNLVRIIPVPSAPGSSFWTDYPKPGTYWYIARRLNADGNVASANLAGPYTFT